MRMRRWPASDAIRRWFSCQASAEPRISSAVARRELTQGRYQFARALFPYDVVLSRLDVLDDTRGRVAVVTDHREMAQT